MRAIMVMYDSLNRRFLESYGTDTDTRTPNFKRLQEKTIRFDSCYVGSLPCMPARRELHTGRYNFLHAPWGYVEPFDESVPKLLRPEGVHTHLVSDHYHYWENAGGNYHCQYSTWDAVRGQEGDPWIAKVNGVDTPTRNNRKLGPFTDLSGQDMVNRTLWQDDETMRPMHRTFEKGLEFLRENRDADRWFLTIETFDPHEPFDAPPRLRELYEDDYDGPVFDWDKYAPVSEAETEDDIKHLRACYKALVTYCDEQLGRILDYMDQADMWKDTMLIVCTDHGHFLSEKGFWAKNYMPVYNEIANTPLFIWDPQNPVKGEVRSSLVQTIDIPATLMEFFDAPMPKHMQGQPLQPVIRDDTPVRSSGLFGYFGQMTCMVDDEYIFMRAAKTEDNTPINCYTWMLHSANSVDTEGEFSFKRFDFTDGLPVPAIPFRGRKANEFQQRDLLFDRREDPNQENPIDDPKLIDEMCRRMAKLMRESEAPEEQFVRLGLV